MARRFPTKRNPRTRERESQRSQQRTPKRICGKETRVPRPQGRWRSHRRFISRRRCPEGTGVTERAQTPEGNVCSPPSHVTAPRQKVLALTILILTTLNHASMYSFINICCIYFLSQKKSHSAPVLQGTVSFQAWREGSLLYLTEGRGK